MNQIKLLGCIEFFNKLKVFEEDVTTDSERAQGYLVVIVTYEYEGQSYKTKRLFYKEIASQGSIHNLSQLQSYFNSPIYWLDIETHDWPHGKGAEIEKTVIKDMFNGDNSDFEKLLKLIANNRSTGFLQEITWDGRTQMYGHNFENNNHWHDLVKLIQYVIKSKGKMPPKEYFTRLVFKWHKEGRDSLSPDLGGRKMIWDLLNNIKAIQTQLSKMELSKILLSKKQIILQGPPGTGKTYTAKDIAYRMIFNQDISKDVEIKKEQLKQLEKSEQFSLVQFHPSYSYEDFVRGITAKSNGTQIEYITENKIFAKFAEEAHKNLINSEKAPAIISKEKWLNEQFDKFVDDLTEEIEDKGKIEITKSVYLIKVDVDAFRYKGVSGWSENGNRMLFNDIKQAYLDENNERQDIKHNQKLSGLARWHASYYIRVLDLFRKYLKDNKIVFIPSDIIKEELKKYILIIDEINRANLPSVLGELIYALEYRGEKVESMYDIEGDNSLIIPPNLLIIGTMNTADRSVGHIDYAIRRRFAFVDILPDASVIENTSAKALFEEISILFHSKDTLASDFKAAQVQLGHSYFIVKDDEELQLKAKYEIVPILEEYLKDGILLEKAEKVILDLKQRFDN
ncbi:AAA family ATPase [Flavobacterium sp. 120]|uniref:AAA family ATPase n=1 Tax=Flavobacterium sp. 120 TaxID=2135626 RepID=UPI000EAE9E32|nr:AAA family ATPase [Flavobacterium sp. 120]RKS12848.1 dynein-related subfamily AAA family protein [Flavobacterium sp. 120]